MCKDTKLYTGSNVTVKLSEIGSHVLEVSAVDVRKHFASTPSTQDLKTTQQNNKFSFTARIILIYLKKKKIFI